jgi:hypothetical protein
MRKPPTTTEAEDELGRKGLVRRHDTLRAERRSPSIPLCAKYRTGASLVPRVTSDAEESLRLGAWKELPFRGVHVSGRRWN